MTFDEFIKHKMREYIKAAKTLNEMFEVNEVRVSPMPNSISLFSGIEKIAELFDCEIKETEERQHGVLIKHYEIEIDGISILQSEYIKIKEE